MGNIWVDTNQRTISGIERQITEAIFKNEHQDLPLQQILQLFKGAVIEINKLEVANLDLKNKNAALEKQGKEPAGPTETKK